MKNERQLKQQEKQDRIKLGLDPPPPPKVKLSNLMNVLTNESIKDPTAVENRVKRFNNVLINIWHKMKLEIDQGTEA